MSASCCESKNFDGVSAAYKRALIAVITINAVMFFVEMTAGFKAGSQALKADALDFAADAATYAISLAVIGMPLSVRAKAALFKGASLAVIALAVLGTTIARFWSGDVPVAETISLIGLAALVANLVSVLILMKWRDGDANVRSVWLCSRNDAIGNVGVIAAGGLVMYTGSALPDLIIAFLMAGLFLKSSASILKQAWDELKHGEPAPASCH